ncbi:MAG TPA: hypothetical protein VF383_15520 [Candidatus Dormibacteraeota bacterium]
MANQSLLGPIGAVGSACLLLITAACASIDAKPAHTPASSAAASPATPSGANALELCFRPIPADWAAAMSGKVATLDSITFGPAAVDDSDGVVYGYFRNASQQGVAFVNLQTGKLTVVSTMTAAESGVIWMTYADGWLVWAQGESTDLIGNWSIQAWNATTHVRLQLATSKLPDGTYLQAEEVFPVVGHGYVAWNQPTSETSVDLRVYRLDTRSEVTLDSGKLSSPVFASNYLVWAKFVDGANEPSFRFADVDTLQPVSVPPELRASRPITFLAGSNDVLVWTANPLGTSSTYNMGVDWLAKGQLRWYSSSSQPLQFPFVAGGYMVWSTPDGNAVADLSTGGSFVINGNGAIAAAGDTIVVASLAPGPKGAAPTTSLSMLHPTALQGLGTCTG